MQEADMEKNTERQCQSYGSTIDNNEDELSSSRNKEIENIIDEHYEQLMKDLGCDYSELNITKDEILHSLINSQKFEEEMSGYFDNDWCIDGTEIDKKEKFYETIYELTQEAYNQEDGIDNVHKAVDRMIRLFKSLGIDLSNLDDQDNMRLIVFLFTFSRNENVRYAELFKPYLENLEYVSEEEKTRNGEIMAKLSIYLRMHCNQEFVRIIDTRLCRLENLSLVLLKKLKEDVNKIYVINKKMETVYRIVKDTSYLHKMEKSNLPTEPQLTIFEKFYLRLVCYYEAILQKDMVKVCEYIENLELDIDIKKVNKEYKIYESLFCDRVEIKKIVAYAEKKVDVIRNLAGINMRVFKPAKELLKKYMEILEVGHVTEVTGLHVLVMIEEITKNLKKEEGKEMSQQNCFYRHKTSDKQKSFKAALRAGKDASFFIQELLKFRLDAWCYAYLGAEGKYKFYIGIMKAMYENQGEFSKCKKSVEVIYLYDVLRQKYIEAIELIKNGGLDDFVPCGMRIH